MDPVYLDYNATTPVDPVVAEAMKPYLSGLFGNPSSAHYYGFAARNAVEESRKKVATLIGCSPEEIIFTSGGTESDNMAIRGIARAERHQGNHIITSAIEHPAVIEACRYLEQNGFMVTYLPVDEHGVVRLDELKKSITGRTILVSIMHANNETGTIQPLHEISELTRKAGIALHTDAAQTIGKINVKVDDLGVDLLTIAGHKFYAPKGVGALYIRNGVTISRLIHGADHEHELRAGTENVMAIAGLGAACEMVSANLPVYASRMKETRDILEEKLKHLYPEIKINGHPVHRLPNTLSVSFPGYEADLLLTRMEDVAASAGAACHSDKIHISHVLEAMHVPADVARGTIRFSTGRNTTVEEIERTAEAVGRTLKSLGHTSEKITMTDPATIRLTHYTAGLGCACKTRPQALEKILEPFGRSTDPNVLVDTSTADDASVYRINDDIAIVQTVDFFTPVVDVPYDFGAVAAANALSDIYAMGAVPLYAQSIVCFPTDRLPMAVLQEIIRGARDKCREASIEIIGGHTIDDNEPKYGLVVTGRIHPSGIVKNSGAQPGDCLIITKPIGTGILSTAAKRGMLGDKETTMLVSTMTALNDKAARIMMKYSVNACTDVTGFGLLGHLLEMTRSAGVNAEINHSRVPSIPGCLDLIARKMIPGGTRNNLDYVNPHIRWGKNIPEPYRILLCDAQTSGGLLIAVPPSQADKLLGGLLAEGINDASMIGRMLNKGDGNIHII